MPPARGAEGRSSRSRPRGPPNRSTARRRPARPIDGRHRRGSPRRRTADARRRRSARPSTQSSIRSSRARPASLRRSWIARWSSRASPSARRSSVSWVSMTTTRPSSWATAVPGRGVARISTSSGGERDAAEGHGPVRPVLDRVLAGGGHDRGDRGAVLPADLRQERLHPPLDELRLVADQLDRADVDLVADQPDQGVPLGAGRRPAAPATSGRAAGASGSPPSRGASGPARRRSGPSPSPPRARVPPGASSSDGQRVRWTESGASARSAARLPYIVSVTNGRTGAAIRQIASRAPWSVANAAARSAPSSFRENRFRDSRRYQVERSSMNVEIARVAPTASVSARRSRTTSAVADARERIQRSSTVAVATGRTVRAGVGAGPRRPAGQPRVGDEERVDVPQDEQLAPRLVGGVPAEEDVLLGPGLREQPAHDVDAHPLGGLVEVDRVAPALVHRPAVLAEDEGVAEDRLERRLAAEDRRHREHRVEPVAELAREALGDEVGREPLRPVLRVLAVVERRERDDPGVQPRVADVLDPLDRLAARRAGDRHLVHERPVRGVARRTGPSRRPPARGARRGPPTTSNVPHVLAVVDRQRQAPVALLADHPVVHVQEPVELPVVAEARDPPDPVHDLHDLVAEAGVDLRRGQLGAGLVVDRAHRDVPLVDEAEDERRPAPPAVRVAVVVGLEPLEAALALQVRRRSDR